ncbi:PhoPQ-activated protein PqaA family protein [Pantoea cypripedii]|uniref:PhoPQ-activated pathogenicity-related family protein n=1 Tax=Pantoea cypripedii TaxID=55209 RepID=UPI002FCA7D1A
MKIRFMVFMLLLFVSDSQALLKENKKACNKSQGCDFSHVLPDYRKKISLAPIDYIITEKESLPQLELKRYRMTSQSWSPDLRVSPDNWQHEVDIFIPEKAKSERAILVINNGVNYGVSVQDAGAPTDFSEEILANIARKSHTIVISVSNVPNQFLTFQNDNTPLKEDDSVARSWLLFLAAPEQRELMPLHIPMAASVSQAMRLARKELISWNINKFIVTGVSKRGWVSWLTAISDPDVEAIIPFAFDLLDTRTSLTHMYRSYGGNWPVAFYPYYKQGIDQLIDTDDFAKLLDIEDPLNYLKTSYRSRLSIPKYIINSSGDDFYVPDNTRFYFDELPGVKSLRIVPNSDHYGIKKFTEESIIPFINRLQNNRKPPEVRAKLQDNALIVEFSEKPLSIVRWTASNPHARDFRYACGIRYQPSTPVVVLNKKIKIPVVSGHPGWQATYIEATFKDGYIATTQAYITPEDKYAQVAPPASGAACQTLPGRGLGDDSR